MKVEYRVSTDILARNRLGPEFLHEEHLVCELWRDAVSSWPSFPDPVSQVAHKVKEKVSIWNADHCDTQSNTLKTQHFQQCT